MSLLCKLKKLVHQGILKEEDLYRIVIIPKNTTNGDVAKAVWPYISKGFKNVIKINDWWDSSYREDLEWAAKMSDVREQYRKEQE